MRIRHSLYVDDEGDVWKKTTEGPRTTVTCLGTPRAGLLDDLPEPLREEMIALIDDRVDALRFGLACAIEDEATYRKQKL